MTNLLLELLEHRIEHFITKSFITCGFDADESRTEYHVYFKYKYSTKPSNKKNKNIPKRDLVGTSYKPTSDFNYLKCKIMHHIEKSWFNDQKNGYEEVFSDKNGSVFTHKNVGFTKEKSPQMLLYED